MNCSWLLEMRCVRPRRWMKDASGGYRQARGSVNRG
jgi:hypothetical protein